MHRLRLWSGATEQSVEIVTINTATLGDRSYLAHDGQLALVIDPQRDIGRVLAVAAERGVRVTDVFETHIHNDYLTGGLALARATGAAGDVSLGPSELIGQGVGVSGADGRVPIRLPPAHGEGVLALHAEAEDPAAVVPAAEAEDVAELVSLRGECRIAFDSASIKFTTL